MSTPDDTQQPSKFSVFNVQANRRIYNEFLSQQERDRHYIQQLERLLKENGINIPSELVPKKPPAVKRQETDGGIMPDASLTSLEKTLDRVKDYGQFFEIGVQYRNLTFWSNVSETTISTVGSVLKSLICGTGPKRRVNILNDLTGRILPGQMTLIMGPPGCGKTSFLKALSGQLAVRSAHLEGQILYNGDPIDCGKYLVGKVATYVEEKEQHAATLTVNETLDFAWMMTTKGHHSYGVAKDDKAAEFLDRDDAKKSKLKNIIKVLGLSECANTYVGDASIRGVSGGQKRRVTLGEMLMPPRRIKYMDAISNGLDAATTYDIIQALRYVTHTLSSTTVISLLQPAPAVFYTFDDLILMSQGEIIYHGPTRQVVEYFAALGYSRPDAMDVADFLQELPTADGVRFTIGNKTAADGPPPVGTAALVQAWKESELYRAMVADMDIQLKESTGQWPAVYREKYPGKFWFNFTQCLYREAKLTVRNTTFLQGRIIQSVLIGAIAGSLFSDLPVEDSNTMSGILFFAALFGALSAMSMIPIIYHQRAVFYKHSRALFFPTPPYVLAQTVVMYPMQILETIVFTTIVYWSVGLTADVNGSRYFTFMFVVFVFTLCVSQFFRFVASVVAMQVLSQMVAGVAIVLMVLFSGFIIPKSNIPPGWVWFYWINPIAYVLRCVTTNEFLASDYDFPVCLNVACTQTQRFGDLVLESRGNPTEQVWVWYGVAVMVGLYLLFLVLTTLALNYLRLEPTPPPPAPAVPPATAEELAEKDKVVEIPFDPVTFSFKDIWYTVKVGKGRKKDELDLLKGVSGYFEPGTVTALMGSSGAGKTTLLDVLAGRKNTGTVSGGMFINGKPKDEATFRRTMGYVEQFDSLSPNDTAREAVEFSAALRLPGDTPADVRANWVTSVLTLLELTPLENTMVGSAEAGGMTFEQKKLVSIAVELAANPAILFLDEPTSGLDSRAAQVVIRSIKRVAASGRSIVCTIHQPSVVIFEAFDSLLLLRRGGQTVYFGELGEQARSLVAYLEAVPGVAPKPAGVNPATWMLEVIGAGTSAHGSTVDFHAYYNQSALCQRNTTQVAMLCPNEEAEAEATDPLDAQGVECMLVPSFFKHESSRHDMEHEHHSMYNVSRFTQFRWLMYRFMLSYWRSPTYNFARMVVSIVIALIFSSTYADQKYSSDVDVISRVALIYITTMFMGVVGMMSVQPVVFAERPGFYREQFSKIYDVKLYTLAATLVEIPYLIVSSVIFLIPYFFIVGFDKDGVADKFFWYWLFQGLYMSTMVFLGHFLASALPNPSTANVIAAMCSTFISLFCGFMIKPEDFPSFWIFMYWLDPLHYVLEGVVVTQFNRDDSLVRVTGTPIVTTASNFVESFYSEWRYGHRGYDVLALFLFIIAFRIAAYFALEYLRHDKR